MALIGCGTVAAATLFDKPDSVRKVNDTRSSRVVIETADITFSMIAEPTTETLDIVVDGVTATVTTWKVEADDQLIQVLALNLDRRGDRVRRDQCKRPWVGKPRCDRH
jgi:hypothetical protein